MFVQCLVSQINQIETISDFYFCPEVIDKATGNVRYELLVVYEQLQPDPVPSVIKFEPAVELKPKPLVEEIEIDYMRMRYVNPVYSLLRFNAYAVPIALNRSLFRAKAFYIKSGVPNEVMRVYVFFDHRNTIIKIKHLRGCAFDKELSDYVFNSFVSCYLQQVFTITLK